MMSQTAPSDLDGTSDRPRRSHSNADASAKDKSRPKSRGSTTSLQSVGVGTAFQPTPQPILPMEQDNMYVSQQNSTAPAMYADQGDDPMLQQYQQNVMQQQHGLPHQDIRPMSQQGFQPLQQQFGAQYQNGMSQFPMHPHMQHMRQNSYEGSPAPEDSSGEAGAARRKKGTPSTQANDNELRRLLAQNNDKNLREIASEVQRSEGSGGKSEKAKQVFAMLWLRESCDRTGNSVRRDRVFARYTERCANERVPTLNPASFGKLVRIIFPNVQTRRLGVRGESKYHYVDLSLKNDDDARPFTSTFERPRSAGGIKHERQGSTMEANNTIQAQLPTPTEPQSIHPIMDTADFPSPGTSFRPQLAVGHIIESQPPPQNTVKIDCQYRNTATIRFPIRGLTPQLAAALPSVRPGLSGTMPTYLGMPTTDLLSQPPPAPQDAPFELPDIHRYLVGTNYDLSIAKSLFHLYRSYCVDVIDAFRKCKEKPFFNHHSAYSGKMTVPVSRLFNMECLAPWIQECDMRMYKQIVKFIGPLALQAVPDLVWNVFERIGLRLVSHIIQSFEEKCPVKTVVAKAVPAARFANLLRKLKGANAAVQQMNQTLDNLQLRTQMWLDLMVMVEPDRLCDDSTPPPESLAALQGILRYDLRTLVDPIEGGLVCAAEEDETSPFAVFLNQSTKQPGVLSLDMLDRPTSALEKWISWLESLPQAFEGHHPQCLLDWHTKFWRSLMMQVGSGGAHSYHSWWYVESFCIQMLGWMAEMQGLLMSEDDQRIVDQREHEKSQQEVSLRKTTPSAGLKRKRVNDIDSESDDAQPRSKKLNPILNAPFLPPHTTRVSSAPLTLPLTKENEEPLLPSLPLEPDDDTDEVDFETMPRDAVLDLPSIHTGLTSPTKRPPPQHHTHASHLIGNRDMNDDSGIGLGIDDSMLDEQGVKEARKFNKSDWFMSSDPVEGGTAGGQVGVVA